MTDDKARPLGEWLRQRREELGITLEQAETDTRIRLCYLEALEAERYDALPDAVVGRGFLRNYARYLELDPAEAVRGYSVHVAPPEPESRVAEGSSPFEKGPFRPLALHDMPAPGSRRLWLVLAGVILIAILGTLGGLAWWHYPRVSGWISGILPSSRGATATLPVSTRWAVLATATHTATALETATWTPTPLVAEANPGATQPATPTWTPTLPPTFTPSPPPSPSQPVYTGIFVELVFTDTSWIQVTVDDVREFQGELDAGTYRSWYGDERVELRIGNAGAVSITLNGQKLGPLGAVGEVVDRIFEKVGEDVQQATATALTPEVSGTPGVTPTLSITPSPAGAAAPTAPNTPNIPIAPTGPVTATVTATATAPITPTATP